MKNAKRPWKHTYHMLSAFIASSKNETLISSYGRKTSEPDILKAMAAKKKDRMKNIHIQNRNKIYSVACR